MPAKKQEIQQKLQLLRQQYADKLPAKLAALQKQWQAPNLDPQSAQFESLVREFHSLAGSGTSFGFPQITTLSRDIENILLGIKSTNEKISQQLRNEIDAKLSSLQQAATQGQ